MSSTALSSSASPGLNFSEVLLQPRAGSQESDRVRCYTARAINRAIDRETDRSITRHAALSDQRIRERIGQLDQEWDIERVLEVNAGALGLLGVLLAHQVNQKWLILPGVVLVFLIQHATQGWCPPLPALRRLGVRTRSEIDREKYTLISLLDAGGISP
jgi:hypothetical protein